MDTKECPKCKSTFELDHPDEKKVCMYCGADLVEIEEEERQSIDDDSDRIWFRYPSLKFICNFNNVVGWIYGLVGTLACIGFLVLGLQQSGWVIPAAIGAWFGLVLIPTIAIFASSELLKIAVRCEVHLRDVSEQLKKK